jgi:hypothetical protein
MIPHRSFCNQLVGREEMGSETDEILAQNVAALLKFKVWLEVKEEEHAVSL